MVKKKFIDKKSATTFSLVYRSTEDSDDRAERVLVDAQKGVGVGRPDAEVAARAADAAAAAGRRCAGQGGRAAACGKRGGAAAVTMLLPACLPAAATAAAATTLALPHPAAPTCAPW